MVLQPPPLSQIGICDIEMLTLRRELTCCTIREPLVPARLSFPNKNLDQCKSTTNISLHGHIRPRYIQNPDIYKFQEEKCSIIHVYRHSSCATISRHLGMIMRLPLTRTKEDKKAIFILFVCLFVCLYC